MRRKKIKIVFSVLRYKNFLSSGNSFTEINLNDSPTTVVFGKNGSGKTTFIDALTYVLFGKAYRNINKPQLVNSINNSNCVVEVEFEIGSRYYKIIRGMKPTIFEIYCNGVLKDQDSKSLDYQDYLEKDILKFNLKTFRQTVVLNNRSFIPFMSLVALDRRNVVEILLDIEIYSLMFKQVKTNIAQIKDAFEKIQKEMTIISEKIELQKNNLNKNKDETQEIIDRNILEINEYNSEIDSINEEIFNHRKNLDKLSKKYKKTELDKKRKQLKEFDILSTRMSINVSNIKRDISFYTENDVCPTCTQVLDSSFKETKIHECNENEKKYAEDHKKILSNIKSLDKSITEIQQYAADILNINNTISILENRISGIKQYITKLETTNSLLSEKVALDDIDDGVLKLLKDELKEKHSEMQKLVVEKKYYDIMHTMLKDNGIKTSVIKHYLPAINKFINDYLVLMDFNVNFSFDQNFEETILSRHRDVFSYENFSDGEKLRIDIAILFAWRHIAKIKNSVDINVLILDELMDASLDLSGTDDFFRLIFSQSSSTNIFIVSPKGETFRDKFNNSILFEKKNNFSEITYNP